MVKVNLEQFNTNDYTIRYLEQNDYNKGFLELLSQLTTITNKNYESFISIFNILDADINSHCIVIEHNNRIIGHLKVIIEPKFGHNYRPVSHFEDIVIDKEYQKKGLGSILLQIIHKISKEYNCYKIIANCNNDVIKFYQKNNYKIVGNEIRLDLNN